MKTRLVILCLLWHLVPQANAQTKQPIDSLKRVLAQLEKQRPSYSRDTSRSMVMHKIGTLLINTDSCMEYFEQALNITKTVGWKKGQAIALNSLGRKIKRNENLHRAGELFFKALLLAENIQDFEQIAYSSRNLGDTYARQNQPDSAKKYYEKSIQLYQKIKNKDGVLTCLNNLGILYYRLAQYNKAISYYKSCLQLNRQFQVIRFDGYAYSNIAVTYLAQKQLENAALYAGKAIEILSPLEKQYPEDKASVYLVMSNILVEQKQYNHALKYIKTAEKLNQTAQLDNNLVIYDLKYRIYYALGDNKKALDYLLAHRQAKDSLSKVESASRNRAMRFEYDLEKQNINNIELKTKLDRESNIRLLLIAGLVIFLLFIGLILRNNYLLSNKNRQIEQQQKAIMIIQEQLKQSNQSLTNLNNTLEERVQERTEALTEANYLLIEKNREIQEALFKGKTIERKRVAAELHDNLGSMISGISWRIQVLDADELKPNERKVYEEVLNMLKNAYNEVRLLSHNLLPTEFEKDGLKGGLENLIYEINLTGRINALMNFQPQSELNQRIIEFEIYIICLELMNNVLKHANASEVIITVNKQNDLLEIHFEDNGKGDISTLDFTRGKGIKNINERVRSLNGTIYFGNRHPFGVIVSIQVPMNSTETAQLETSLSQ